MTEPGSDGQRRFACDHAVVAAGAADGAGAGADDGGGAVRVADRVVVTVTADRITAVEPDSPQFDQVAAADVHLPGVTLPGLVNAHSHAFHRMLRGRTQAGTGTFWTWREQMYDLAAVLDPDGYHQLARGTFAEMLAAGITCVGEFHYLHHQAGGHPYADPNAMGEALVTAAVDVGIRITLLDALYLTAGIGDSVDRPRLDPVQQRFSDRSVPAWTVRLADLRDRWPSAPTVGVGAALHSIRAVPPPAVAEAVTALEALGSGDGLPVALHAHVAEQPAEVDRAREVHGASPVTLLDRAGALGPKFTAVHAVWLDEEDIGRLGHSGVTVCACPTTERDLADGVVPARSLLDAGARLALGTDQHSVVDLFEESRALELDLRLTTQRRGTIPPAVLLAAATSGGAASLGWPAAGRLVPGALADLCVVGLDSVRLAGLRRADLLAGLVHAATAADVTHTIVGGEVVVAGGRHRSVDAAGTLRRAIDRLDSRLERPALR